MSPKKKRSNRKKAFEKKVAEGKSTRKLIPFTAGRLPSVSKSMPQAASAVPLVSKEIPLVSKPIPLVSAVPNITLPRYWGIMPSRIWGASGISATRKRSIERPKDIGLLRFLGKVITAGYQPLEMIEKFTSAIYSQAEQEKDPKATLEQELLELKMRRETNEISEEDYKIEETKLKKRMKDLKRRRR